MPTLPAEPSKILIAMPTWVGDGAMVTPVIEALHAKFPGAAIDLLLKTYLTELFDGAPWLNKRHEISETASFWLLRKELAAEQYDWGLLFTNSFRPALLMRMAGVKRRVGYARNFRSWLLTDALTPPNDYPHRMVDYYGALGGRVSVSCAQRPIRLYRSREEQRKADALFATHGLDKRPLVGINPGAKFGQAKCWPPESFAVVADSLIQQFKAQVVVLAGPGEDPIAQAVVAAMREPAAVIPSKDNGLGVLKAVISKLDLLITNDTGPRQYATAFEVPSVVIFGSTHTAWGDTGDPKAAYVQISVDCGPCMKRVCPLGHHKCMRDLTPDMVSEAAARQLLKFGPLRSSDQTS